MKLKYFIYTNIHRKDSVLISRLYVTIFIPNNKTEEIFDLCFLFLVDIV